MNLPLTVIGGYLGAGKTTLVNHLLRNAAGRRLAVLVNEFGALPIDEDLIEARDEDMISIAGGCVCCSYGNDLVMALMRLRDLDPAPDHVLLEASGVAIPGAIAASLTLLQGYTLDGIVVLANAETIIDQGHDTYVGDTVRRQLKDADLVILNKSDLVPATGRDQARNWIREQRPDTGIIEAVHGALPLDVLLRGGTGDEPMRPPASPPGPHPFETHAIALPDRADPEALAAALADPALGLIRAKGFLRGSGPGMLAIQTVGRRWVVEPVSTEVKPGAVVIGLKGRLDLAAIETAIARIPSRA